MILKLRPRLEGAGGLPAWHDVLALQRAINFSSRGRPMSQLGVHLSVAKKIQIVQAGAKGQVNATLEIELENGEAEVFWDAIKDLPPDAFWPGQLPPILTVKEFLDDVEGQLNVEES